MSTSTSTSATRCASPTPAQKREWNRSPLNSLFPRLTGPALESILSILHARRIYYDLSKSQLWNARRYTRVIVAHVRHAYTEYDGLLDQARKRLDQEQQGMGEGAWAEEEERYAARTAVAEKMWKKLREWSPWESDNPVLERCFRATLVPPTEWGEDFDAMDVDDEEEMRGPVLRGEMQGVDDYVYDPMDLD